MREYATLIAFAGKFTLQPIVSHKMKKVLRKVFDHLPSEQFGFRETIQLETTQHEWIFIKLRVDSSQYNPYQFLEINSV